MSLNPLEWFFTWFGIELDEPQPLKYESCVRCRFFVKTNLHREGSCRRHSPREFSDEPYSPMSIPGSGGAIWPVVCVDWWCGDFERKGDDVP